MLLNESFSRLPICDNQGQYSTALLFVEITGMPHRVDMALYLLSQVRYKNLIGKAVVVSYDHNLGLQLRFLCLLRIGTKRFENMFKVFRVSTLIGSGALVEGLPRSRNLERWSLIGLILLQGIRLLGVLIDALYL